MRYLCQKQEQPHPCTSADSWSLELNKVTAIFVGAGIGVLGLAWSAMRVSCSPLGISLLGTSLHLGIVLVGARNFLPFHLAVITAASPAVKRSAVGVGVGVVRVVLGKSFLGLAGVSWHSFLNRVTSQEESLANETTGNFLNLVYFIFSGLGSGSDDGELLMLVGSVKGMNSQMLGIEVVERRQKVAIDLLDEPVADTDGVDVLGLKEGGGSHKALIEFNNGGCDQLTVRARSGLMDVLQSCVGLVTVPRAELVKNCMADLLVS
jgi:hypothetical protein